MRVRIDSFELHGENKPYIIAKSTSLGTKFEIKLGLKKDISWQEAEEVVRVLNKNVKEVLIN